MKAMSIINGVKSLKKKKLLIIGLAVLVVAVIFFSFSDKGLEIEVMTLKPKTVVDTFSEDGTIKQGDSVDMLSEVSGTVLKVVAEENSHVNPGDVIAIIDSKDYINQKNIHLSNISAYQAQKAEALNAQKRDKQEFGFNVKNLKEQLRGLESKKVQGNINQTISDSPEEYLKTLKLNQAITKSDYDFSKRNYEAYQALYDSGNASKNELDEAQKSFLQAESAYNASKNRYEESQRRLSALKAQGISETDLNKKFYASQDEDFSSAIQSVKVQIASLENKISQDYASDTAARLDAMIEIENVSVKQLDDDIANCTVKAERAGIIKSLPVKKLSSVNKGDIIAVTKSKDKFTVDTDVLTSSEPYLKNGDKVKLTHELKGEDQIFYGTIRKIYDFAEEQTSALGLKEYRVPVEIDVDNTEIKLKDGYEVTVEFEIFKQENLIAAPNSAIFEKEGKHYVFTAKGETAALTPVEIGHKTNTETVVTSGLAENAVIIYNADTQGLNDKVQIRPKMMENK